MPSIKEQLYQQCMHFVGQRTAGLERAMRELQESANEETKSSSGDKYETGRAMAQLEIEKLNGQLAEARKMTQALTQIRSAITDFILPGNLVITNQGNFYISISAGQLTIGQKKYFAVSPESPIGKKLMGSKPGDSFTLNNKEFIIEQME